MCSILNEEFFEGLTGEVRSREAVESERFERRAPQPTLILGLGGTGAETAARLKQHLQVEYGHVQEHADMIKFLLFDTIGLLKQQNSDIVRTFSESEEEYVNLAQDFNGYGYLQENYAKDRNLRDWWDNRYHVSPQYQEWGAKRVRQLGRLFLHQMHYQVESIIQQKVVDTCTLYEDLVRDQNLADVGGNFRVYVISSSCGGTGSGIFLDILYKVWRAVLSQGRVPEIRSFIFLPGVYEEEARKRSLELTQAHRANAYSFLKELDYFLSPGSDLNKYILDTKTRDSSQRVNIPAGNLSKYVYLIDKQLGNIGNLERPEDAYDLTADAMYQMIVTPVGQEEEGVGLTNIDAVVEPSHQRQGKRTAYSSLGLSRILFPRHTIQSQLVYRFLRDMIYTDLTATDTWMDESIERDERLAGLCERLGPMNMVAIDDLCRPALDFVAQIPTGGELARAVGKGRFDKLTKEIDLNDSRITEGLFLIDHNCRGHEGEAKKEAVEAVINLVDHCELGVAYVQKTVLAAKKSARELLRQLREEKAELGVVKGRHRVRLNKELALVEQLTGASLVPFRNRNLNQASRRLASALRDLTEASFQERIADRKQHLLTTLVGQEQVVEEYLEDEEIRIGRKVQRSVIDRELDKLDLIIGRLNRLAERADERRRDRSLAKADRGATITTQIFPHKVLEALESSEFQEVYAEKVGSANMSKHVKAILARLNETQNLHGQGLYDLAEADQEVKVNKVLIAMVSEYVRQLFKETLTRTAVDAVNESVGQQKFSEQVMGNLFELSQPCWNYDKEKAHDPGTVDLPRTYSLGYSDPDVLPVPEGQNRPGLVRTSDNHQVTLLQAQHGLPLFALRVMPTLRADYKQYMRRAKLSGSQPLHIRQDWSRDIDALPDLRTSSRLDEDTVCEFALGLFTDYLVFKKDPVILGLIEQEKIDSRLLRGYIFAGDAQDYYAVQLVEADKVMQMGSIETLSASGRLEAAENLVNFPEVSKQAGRLVGELEKLKQYHLITDIEEYLDRVIVSEVKRRDDEEEREMLKREYEALTAYIDRLKDQRDRGLPLAG